MDGDRGRRGHDRVADPSPRLLPSLSALLVIALILINPGGMSQPARIERTVALVLVAVVSAINAASGVQLADGIITGSITNRPGSVLAGAAIVYWTTIVVFSLWYWEFDRGGPARNATGGHRGPEPSREECGRLTPLAHEHAVAVNGARQRGADQPLELRQHTGHGSLRRR